MNKPFAKAAAENTKRKKVLAYLVEVEGNYWGDGLGGHVASKGYNVKIVVPANYNDGGKGNTYIKKVLLGKITGTPYLRTFKDDNDKVPYQDYRQLRTHNIVDWQDVTDEETAAQAVREKAPTEMSADELKRALTKLGITYPNPARKAELVELLGQALVKAKEEAEERPSFTGPKGSESLDKNINEVDIGTMVNTSVPDPNNPLLPAETGRYVDSFTT
ncbi:HeH/LEM domain containing protein [uncultured Caudovirales phage]|uniref:HeH/LEM domain containing protein n=1 Tax=uncultured Caudovirales phage TaxID=2100421 RepID=A0A6J5LZ01_9CAUD|nr:HeH/LEM domain containing protein [uncultured Caudovirales phage]